MHREGLLQRFAAHGAGVGRTTGNPALYAIVLYVEGLPAGDARVSTVDDIPLEFVVTDRFKPLGHRQE